MISHIPRLAIFLAAFAVLVTSTAQAPSDLHSRHPISPRTYPVPTNLKVLSRGLSGRRVNEIMEQWSAQLGVRCGACHLRTSERVIHAGPHENRFADDSKPMKQAARIMYTMTLEINRKFITGDDGVPGPVTCGTCHRGYIRPEPFMVAPDTQPFAEGDPPQ